MDGQTNTQDALPKTGQPSGEGQNPSKPTVYTEEEVNKRHAKLDKTISELTKERDANRQSLEALKAEFEQIKKEREESELEKVKDDPDALNAYQLRKKQKEAEESIKAEKARLEAEKAAHEAELTEARALKRTKLFGEIAKEFQNGDPAVLEKTCDELGITDPDKIRVFAAAKWQKIVGGGKPAPPVDSGLNNGGDDPSKLKPEEKIRRGMEAERNK